MRGLQKAFRGRGFIKTSEVARILGFIMGITLIFTLGDINSLFASMTRQPFMLNAEPHCLRIDLAAESISNVSLAQPYPFWQ